ncbi:hypothetical protein M885DRAFT_549226 [Pelagophyceae sp. CCMP2097]|nr:hypothetical protein M885DRAFT_549226 [Pelagophyceae sp. CCMP2097]
MRRSSLGARRAISKATRKSRAFDRAMTATRRLASVRVLLDVVGRPRTLDAEGTEDVRRQCRDVLAVPERSGQRPVDGDASTGRGAHDATRDHGRARRVVHASRASSAPVAASMARRVLLGHHPRGGLHPRHARRAAVAHGAVRQARRGATRGKWPSGGKCPQT